MSVLTRTLLKAARQFLDAAADPGSLMRGLEQAVRHVSAQLLAQAAAMEGKEAVAEIASLFARDREIGELIAEAIDKVGKDGVVAVEDSAAAESALVFTNGMRFEEGYLSPYLVTDPNRMEAVLEDPYILINQGRISSASYLAPLLEKIAESGRPLLVVADDMDSEAVSALVAHKASGTLKAVAVRAPGLSGRRVAVLGDLAALTGAVVVSTGSGSTLETVGLAILGRARRAVIGKGETIILDGGGGSGAITSRVEQLRAEIEQTGEGEERAELQERLSRLTGGIAVILASRGAEHEPVRRRDLIEAAVRETRAAVLEGVVAGGGVGLVQAGVDLPRLDLEGSEAAGAEMVRLTLEAPLRRIVLDAGLESDIVLDRVRDLPVGHGFSPITHEYVDLIAEGVVAPVRGSRLALESAADVVAGYLSGMQGPPVLRDRKQGPFVVAGEGDAVTTEPDWYLTSVGNWQGIDVAVGDYAYVNMNGTSFGWPQAGEIPDHTAGTADHVEEDPAVAELQKVDRQVVNFWIHERDGDEASVLTLGQPYTGCFRVGRPVAGNLVAGDREIPSADIPESGLGTRWILSSTTVRLEQAPGEPEDLVETEDVAAGDRTSWLAAFDLVIPATGDSEERRLRLTPLTVADPRVDVRVFVGDDLYRELVVGLQVAQRLPPDPDPGSNPQPTPAPAEAEPVLGSAGPGVAGIAISQVVPAAHTGLRLGLDWLRPQKVLRLSVTPPSVNWERFSVEPDGEQLPDGNGNVKWEPRPTTQQRLTALRSALDNFREENSDFLDDIDPADLASRLLHFSPCADWAEPVDHTSDEHRQHWQQLASGRALQTLASNGRALYDALVPDGEELRRLIDELQPGDRLRITWYPGLQDLIPHVPWALLYGGPEPSAGTAVDFGQFLGMRLRVSHLAHSVPGSRALGASEATTRLHVLYWGDAAGDQTGGEAREHKLELARWAPLLLPTAADHRRDEVRDFLVAPPPPPVALVYLYCQCQAGSGAQPILRFGSANGEDDVLEVIDLRGGPFADQPLVFVNACATSAADPFFTNELEELFFERQCRAYIGSECRVPIRFAARFATAFFHFLYLRPGDRAMPAGEAMSQTRKFFWDEYRNPGGLFYSYVNEDRVFVDNDAAVAAVR